MATNSRLSTLITAIATSLAEAQRQLEWSQIETFRSFFSTKKEDDSGRTFVTPRRFKVALPSLRPDAESGERDVYNVPYLTLLPNHGLRIEKAQVDFDVTLGNLDQLNNMGPLKDKLSEPSDLSMTDQFGGAAELTVDIGGKLNRGSLAAKITLTVAGPNPPREPPG